MSLIKKIIACGLAMSVTLSGVCANPTTPVHSDQKTNNTKLNTKGKVIAGLSTAGGIGTLGIICIGVLYWHHSHKKPQDNTQNQPTEKFNVLVIGDDARTRQSFIDQLKSNKPMNGWPWPDIRDDTDPLTHKPKLDGNSDPITYKSSTLFKSISGNMARQYPTKRPPQKIQDWDILQCDSKDPNANLLMQKAKIVIPILSNKESDDRIGDLLLNSDAKEEFTIFAIWDENHPFSYNSTRRKTPVAFRKTPEEKTKTPRACMKKSNVKTIHDYFIRRESKNPPSKRPVVVFCAQGNERLNTRLIDFKNKDTVLRDFSYYWDRNTNKFYKGPYRCRDIPVPVK